MTGKAEIKVDCPKCLASLQIPAEKGGARIDCPECGHSLLVPESQTAGNTIFDDLFDAPSDNVVAEPTSPVTETVEEVGLTSETVPTTPNFDDVETALEEHQSQEQVLAEVDLAPIEQTSEPSLPTIEPNESHRPPAPEDESDPLESLDDPSLDLNAVDLFATPKNGGESLSLEKSDLNTAPIGTDDPFEEDPDKPLSIDGISPTIKVDDIYGIKCKICDTRIHVNISQNGESIECPMCYSDVKVEIDTSERESSPTDSNLQDDTSVTSTINPDKEVEVSQRDMEKLPEFDDQPLTLAPLEPNEPIPVSSLESDRDLLKPVAKEPKDEETEEKEQTSTAKLEPAAVAKRRKKKKKEKPPEYGTKQYWEDKVVEVEPEDHDVPEIIKSDFLSSKDVLGWLSKTFTSPELIYRALVAIVMLGFAYMMSDIFHNAYYDEEMPKFTRILSLFLPVIVGGAALLIGLLALFATCSMVFQNSSNGIAKSEDWPGFSFSDWLGPLLLFGFSLWLGSLPGGLFGALFAVGLSENTWVVVGASMSAFILAPIFYLCVTFNGSAFNIFAPEVFKSLRGDDIGWLYYLPYSMAAWVAFLAGTLILFIPTFIFSGLGAAVQVVALICFAAIAGLHTGRVLFQIQKKKSA